MGAMTSASGPAARLSRACDDRGTGRRRLMRPEAEPFAVDGAPVGVVLCHGLTGMPGSMRPWAEALAAAGLTVRLPRLPGHGTRWQGANKGTRQGWLGEGGRAVGEGGSRGG